MAAVWTRGQQHTHAKHRHTYTPSQQWWQLKVEPLVAKVSMMLNVETVLGFGMQNM